jgi:hypothetical protein
MIWKRITTLWKDLLSSFAQKSFVWLVTSPGVKMLSWVAEGFRLHYWTADLQVERMEAHESGDGEVPSRTSYHKT